MSLVLCFLLILVGIALFLKWYRKSYVDDWFKKSVFITGTDSGFGKELALHLDSKGAKVFAGCYTEDGSNKLRQVASSKMTIVSIDTTKRDTLIRAKEIIEKELELSNGVLWGLVNNAGVLRGNTFCLSNVNDYRSVMEVNFFGTINVTEIFSPLIKKSSGRIVNVISGAGSCSGGIEPYTCSKFAMQPYNDGLRRWMKGYGVFVSAIEPGIFNFTNIIDFSSNQTSIQAEIDALPANLREEYGEEFLKAVKKNLSSLLRDPPLCRFNTPEVIISAMEHALFAKHPKDRYKCGLDNLLIYRWQPYLPDWLSDTVIRRWVYNYLSLPRPGCN